MRKLLYINDYACNPDVVVQCRNGHYPESHLWGIKEFVDNNGAESLRWHQARKSKGRFRKLKHVLENLRIFLKYCGCDVIYSALPGYEWLFLLAKKMGIKKFRIITVVHHPGSRLLLSGMYDKLIFISRTAYERFSHLPNAEYLFWGACLKSTGVDKLRQTPEFDFVSAGKTHRDYELMKSVMDAQNIRYKIFGAKSSTENEISYSELMRFYERSKFICIPMKEVQPVNSVLIGLTSFVDAIALGIPVLMSDNSLIGVDVEGLGLGKIYKTGNTADFYKQMSSLMELTDGEYKEMCANCLDFSRKNSFEKFSKRVNELIKLEWQN